MKTISFFLLLFNSSLYAQSDTALKNTLAKLCVADQKAAGLPPQGVAGDGEPWKHFKDSTFAANYIQAKAIFTERGFPGYDMVGKEGANNFWVLVQHSNKWPGFQEKVLVEMEKQVKKNNASAQDFAFLTDRVRLNTGRAQLYGTQVTYNLDSCQAIPRKLEEPETVNERRKAVGLDPIETYLNSMSTNHFRMNKDVYEKKGIYKPKLYN